MISGYLNCQTRLSYWFYDKVTERFLWNSRRLQDKAQKSSNFKWVRITLVNSIFTALSLPESLALLQVQVTILQCSKTQDYGDKSIKYYIGKWGQTVYTRRSNLIRVYSICHSVSGSTVFAILSQGLQYLPFCLRVYSIYHSVSGSTAFAILSQGLQYLPFCLSVYSICHSVSGSTTFAILSQGLQHLPFCLRVYSICHSVSGSTVFAILSQGLQYLPFCLRVYSICHSVSGSTAFAILSQGL